MESVWQITIHTNTTPKIFCVHDPRTYSETVGTNRPNGGYIRNENDTVWSCFYLSRTHNTSMTIAHTNVIFSSDRNTPTQPQNSGQFTKRQRLRACCALVFVGLVVFFCGVRAPSFCVLLFLAVDLGMNKFHFTGGRYANVTAYRCCLVIVCVYKATYTLWLNFKAICLHPPSSSSSS